MATRIHGWRAYTVGRCKKTQRPTLIGLNGMHVHTGVSPESKCRGFLQYADHVTPEQRQRHMKGEIPEHTSMILDCTCGFYFHRLWPVSSHQTAVAHVTGIGPVALHTEGGRMSKYRIDFIAVPKVNAVLYTMDQLSEEGTPTGWKLEKLTDVLGRIADELGVPLLDPETDPNACRACQEANGWLDQEESSDKDR